MSSSAAMFDQELRALLDKVHETPAVSATRGFLKEAVEALADLLRRHWPLVGEAPRLVGVSSPSGKRGRSEADGKAQPVMRQSMAVAAVLASLLRRATPLLKQLAEEEVALRESDGDTARVSSHQLALPAMVTQLFDVVEQVVCRLAQGAPPDGSGTRVMPLWVDIELARYYESAEEFRHHRLIVPVLRRLRCELADVECTAPRRVLAASLRALVSTHPLSFSPAEVAPRLLSRLIRSTGVSVSSRDPVSWMPQMKCPIRSTEADHPQSCELTSWVVSNAERCLQWARLPEQQHAMQLRCPITGNMVSVDSLYMDNYSVFVSASMPTNETQWSLSPSDSVRLPIIVQCTESP